MDGFIGRVELGSMKGSQFAAGKSYQGVDGSPCIDGSIKGASREDEPEVPFFGTAALSGAPLLCGVALAAFGPSAIAVRS